MEVVDDSLALANTGFRKLIVVSTFLCPYQKDPHFIVQNASVCALEMQ